MKYRSYNIRISIAYALHIACQSNKGNFIALQGTINIVISLVRKMFIRKRTSPYITLPIHIYIYIYMYIYPRNT